MQTERTTRPLSEGRPELPDEMKALEREQLLWLVCIMLGVVGAFAVGVLFGLS